MYCLKGLNRICYSNHEIYPEDETRQPDTFRN